MNYLPISSQEVVLASQAQWRSDILTQLQISHICCDHKYAEPKFSGGNLVEFVEKIAREKAASLAVDYPEALIVAADQLVAIDDEILYKSGSRENAINQLKKLSGKSHYLICAVSIWYRGQLHSRTERADLKMRSLSDQEIAHYVDKDEPWSCAGSYKIESLGASLFETIDTNDPTTIIGIPANQLINLIRSLGFSNLL